jgi:hypothetical protein
MWKMLKLFAITFSALAALNLLGWLFVIGVDVTTIGSGRSKFSNGGRFLLSVADRIYPYVDQILSAHRKVGNTFGMRKYYFSSWFLTISLEALLATPILYGIIKLLRYGQNDREN